MLFPGVEPSDTGNSQGGIEDWFKSCYFRANIDPSERYVLSPAGTAQLRLFPTPAGQFYDKNAPHYDKNAPQSSPPHPSGFSNLYLAGDWTWNYFNQGFFEAAVISGRLAAQGLIDKLGLTSPGAGSLSS